MDMQEVRSRIGYFRNKANLSARELSLRIDKHDTYITKFESNEFNIPLPVLFDIINTLNISCEEFFADNFTNYKAEKEITNIFKDISSDGQKTIIDLMKKLK